MLHSFLWQFNRCLITINCRIVAFQEIQIDRPLTQFPIELYSSTAKHGSTLNSLINILSNAINCIHNTVLHYFALIYNIISN